MVKSLPAVRETQVRSLGREDPLRRKRQPTPVLLPGESHGQRGPSGYSPWGRMGSLIQGVNFDQHNGILQKVLFGVWIHLKVTGVTWDIRKPVYTFFK